MHEVKLEGLAARVDKLAAAASALKHQSGVSAPFDLVFLTDGGRAPQPHLIARILPRGAAVILRDYGHKDRTALAMQLKAVCAARGLFLLVGADPALADKVEADGVHFPSWYDGPRDVFPGALSTASCHSAADLKGAKTTGVDAVMLSPAFPTASHPGAAALGPDNFRQLAAISPAPVLALGGVTQDNARQLAGANVAGIAAIGAFLV